MSVEGSAAVPAARNPLRTLFLVSMLDVLGFGVLVPLVPYLANRFGAAPWLVTAIMGSYSLCQLLAAPLWGRLSDRHGRRPILMTSLLGACASYLLLGLAHNLWMVVLSRMLAGAMAGNLAAAFAYASDVSTPATRVRSMGMVGAAIGIGFMLGMPIGGTLAGNDTGAHNLMLPAVVSMGFNLLALLLVKFRLPESRRGAPAGRAGTTAAGRAPATRSRPLALLLHRPPLRRIVLSALLVTTAQGVLESIFALWALNRFGFGPRTVGYALFVVALGAVLMQGGLVRVLAPRLGAARLAMYGSVAYLSGQLAIGLAGTRLPLVGVGLALCGLGMGAFTPSASALASGQAQDDDRGAVLGTYQSGNSLGRVLGPFMAGPVYAALGAGSPFILAACLALPVSLLLWPLRGSESSRTPTPPGP